MPQPAVDVRSLGRLTSPLHAHLHRLQARISGAIAAAKADVEAARAQVVASPRRIRDELDAAVRGVEAAKAEFNHAEDDRRALERRLEVVAKADRDVAKLLALLAEVDVSRCCVRRHIHPLLETITVSPAPLA